MAKPPNPLRRLLRPVRTLLGLLLRRPLVGASIIPRLPDGRIVLIRRRDTGQWGLPGGMVDWDEDIPAAAKRELKEETGLTLTKIGRLVGVYSASERDPRFHSICVVLEASVDGTFNILDEAEIMDVQAFNAEGLPMPNMAHDHEIQLNDYFAGKTVVA
ncbi:MAG: NUDIX hydrolase [Phormidesmis sp.]